MPLVIAGERSGVGKTTLTLMILACLRRWGHTVQAFKVGPDYIDPQFHTQVTGRPCRNLDPILTSETYVQTCFGRHAQGVSHVLVEGVMGLFDGTGEPEYRGSTAHVARLLNLPVLLVIDCSRLSSSVAALVQGYRTLDARLTLAGVILNRVASDRHRELLLEALAPLGIPVLGLIPRQDDLGRPARHLGLVPPGELGDFAPWLDRLVGLGQRALAWEHLLPLLSAGRPSLAPEVPRPAATVRLGIAQDAAFNFYYADNLDLLGQWGAELVPWSPLQDTQGLPDVHGLVIGGGFPETFAAILSSQSQLHRALRHAAGRGMPMYAECGGLMFLSQSITAQTGETWPMVGLLPTATQMAGRLTLGYRRGVVQAPSPFLHPGELVWGHEFHHSVTTIPPPMPLYSLRGLGAAAVSTPEGWVSNRVQASYLHLHWGEIPGIPQRLVARARAYAQTVSKGQR
ncbi:MAG: cobyrinate a,c-diamide synthase [Gloeomargaritaceae cyanobacterium C42_A2020_066]|nr:cobyrinate a,c-diamide synthase [Gloeomargaritaceae cyanobacterium C42_A2020_066]